MIQGKRNEASREEASGDVARSANERADERAYARRLSYVGFALAAVWLFFLVFPVIDLYGMRSEPVRLASAAAAIALFTATYVWSAWRAVRSIAGAGEPLGAKARWFSLGLLTSLALVIPFAYGGNWVGSLGFVGVIAGLTLPFRLVVAVSAAIAALSFVSAVATGLDWGPFVSITINSSVGGLIAFGLRWLVVTNREIRAARRELARLAVAEERLRFARDLHDLLGRSLSMIVLKSDLAGRLSASSPQRAAGEMREVERAARDALREIREAVAGYRKPSLATEFAGARDMLAAAGIECRIEDETKALPGGADSVLAWAVREGVTNVIRHSRTRRCRIHARQGGGMASVEITDSDDQNSVHTSVEGDAETSPGSGLSGLAERVAASGGEFEAGPLAEGGFRLRVEVPVEGVEENEIVGRMP